MSDNFRPYCCVDWCKNPASIMINGLYNFCDSCYQSLFIGKPNPNPNPNSKIIWIAESIQENPTTRNGLSPSNTP